MTLSGKDLAEKIGCARSTLSEATDKGYLVDGRWDVQEWAVCGPSGRLKHYEVPDRVAFLNAEKRENPSTNPNPPNSGDSAPGPATPEPSVDLPALTALIEEKEETTRQVAEEAGDQTQLVSDETDVEGATRNAGMAYAATKAIEHDTPGAQAFWTVASALAGGVGGHAVTDSPWGAVVGAIGFGCAGYFVYEQQPRRQEGAPPTQPNPRSGQSSGMDGTSRGERSRAVNLNAATVTR